MPPFQGSRNRLGKHCLKRLAMGFVHDDRLAVSGMRCNQIVIAFCNDGYGYGGNGKKDRENILRVSENCLPAIGQRNSAREKRKRPSG